MYVWKEFAFVRSSEMLIFGNIFVRLIQHPFQSHPNAGTVNAFPVLSRYVSTVFLSLYPSLHLHQEGPPSSSFFSHSISLTKCLNLISVWSDRANGNHAHRVSTEVAFSEGDNLWKSHSLKVPATPIFPIKLSCALSNDIVFRVNHMTWLSDDAQMRSVAQYM